MLIEQTSGSPPPTAGLSETQYIGLVDSLLVETKGLVLTLATTVLGSIVVGWATGNPILYGFALLMVLVGAVRLGFMSIHARNRPSRNAAAARKWEVNYVVGATIFIALLGAWTIAVFWETTDGFSRFLSTLTTVSCVFGIWTRSLAINKNGTNVQLLVGFATLSAAFVIAGGLYPVLIATVLAPVLFFIKISSTKLRSTFLAELIARREAGLLATRLDT
ncbi:MAG: hypothetical protein JOZ01_00440, partial [Candidatus Eremiobacteraeota bacterium]|nr:hypothetical protein [Candidatus Eremiobacteraeota bacterium]